MVDVLNSILKVKFRPPNGQDKKMFKIILAYKKCLKNLLKLLNNIMLYKKKY